MMEKPATVKAFFLPAAKKSKPQKGVDATMAVVTDQLESGKSNTPCLKAKRRKEDKNGQSSKGNTLTCGKQSLKSEGADFFKPISKKQKQEPAAGKSGKTGSAAEGPHHVGKPPDFDKKSPSFHFDLKLEAKLVAEETSQHFAGKPTHPFFAQRKAGQRSSNTDDGTHDSGGFPSTSLLDMDELAPLPPFHVTQASEMDACQVDWRTWEFEEVLDPRQAERLYLRDGCCELLSKFMKLNPLTTKTLRDHKPCGERVNKGLEPLLNFLRDHGSKSKGPKHPYGLTDLDHRLRSIGLCYDHTSLPMSVSTAAAGAGGAAKNSLWTDIYQPQSPELVCGNREVVGLLNAWLQSWQTKCLSLASSLEADTNQCADDHDDSREWFDKDSDVETDLATEGDVLHNVLLLTGPVGCGKTAAIYACAREQGYTVIETNCSDNRSGALIKHKFSEATESHRLGNWSTDTATSNLFPFSAKRELPQTLCNGSNSNLDGLHVEGESKMLSVMLFEDADMVFEEDRGFMAALAQLAATTKRPIILTSNDKELCLPHALGSNILEFKTPHTDELLATAYLVCLAEGFTCNPEFLKEVVIVCGHDIRKTLNFLQFWCQGKPSSANVKRHTCHASLVEEAGEQGDLKCLEIDSTTATVLFKLEAQHRLWPAFVSVEVPCLATQSIARKLSATTVEAEKRLCEVEGKACEKKAFRRAALLKKTKRRIQLSKEDNEETGEASASDTISGDDDENGPLQTPVKNLKDAKTVARSPILRRRIRRQLAIVMSDSDDEGVGLASQKSSCYVDSFDVDSVKGEQLITSVSTQNELQAVSMEPLALTEGSSTKDTQSSHVPHEMLKECGQASSQEINHAPENFRVRNLYEEVNNLWSDLKGSKEELDLVLSLGSKKSFPTVLSMSKLADDIAACETILSMCNSKFRSCDQDVDPSSHNVDSEYNECLQMCAHISHISLQICIGECSTLCKPSRDMQGSVTPSDMMLAVNDACTLGKLAMYGGTQSPGCLQCNIGSHTGDQELKRCSIESELRQCLLQCLPSKAQRNFCGSSFYEYGGFLARLGHLGQPHLASGLTRTRGKGCQHYLSSHPWDLPEESIAFLQQLGNFGEL